jgi:hypothetical protein
MLHQFARATCMIEVHVGEKEEVNIARIEILLLQGIQ